MKYEIESVTAEYTGGGIYIFEGKLTDDNCFIAETSCFDVRVMSGDFFNDAVELTADELWEKYEWCLDEDAFPSVKWQEEHLVEDLRPSDALKFIKAVLEWVKENKPNGNYNMGDMDYFLAEVADCEKAERNGKEWR